MGWKTRRARINASDSKPVAAVAQVDLVC
jgi:hypothetical protein